MHCFMSCEEQNHCINEFQIPKKLKNFQNMKFQATVLSTLHQLLKILELPCPKPWGDWTWPRWASCHRKLSGVRGIHPRNVAMLPSEPVDLRVETIQRQENDLINGQSRAVLNIPVCFGNGRTKQEAFETGSTCCHLDILSKDAKALVYWRGVASIKAEWSWWCEEHTWCTFQIRLCPGSEEIFTKRRKITTCKGNNCWSPACFSSISMATCWVYWKVQPVCHWHSAAAANSQLDKLSQAPAPAWAAESAQFIWFFFALYEARPQIWIISIAFCLVEIEMVRVGSSQSFHLTSLQKCWWKIHPPVLEWIM